MQDQSGKGALSVPAAMDYLSVKRTKFYSLISSGQLEAVKIGRRTLIRIEALHKFLDGLPTVQPSPANDSRSSKEGSK